MNLKKHIILISLVLAAWITPLLGQEYVAIVCAGDTGMAYFVQGDEGSSYNWTVEGGTISRNYGDSIIVDWPLEPGEYAMSVQEISDLGCSGGLKKATVLVSAPVIELGSDEYRCAGDFFQITPEGEFSSYLWNDGSTNSSFSTNREGLITLEVTDQYGCAASDELYLEIKPLPHVELGNDTSLCGEQSLYLNAGPDGIKYTWSTNETTPDIMVYHGYQEIDVVVEDEYECINYDTILINECDPSIFFKDIKNAITPSSQDGRNDVWIIEELQNYPEAVVDIYDRWGRLIWRSEAGYPNPWDGRNMRGKEVPMDSYHYIILLNFGDDDRVIGTVTVIR